MFQGHFQHDAQECLRFLLSHLKDAQEGILRPSAHLPDPPRARSWPLVAAVELDSAPPPPGNSAGVGRATLDSPTGRPDGESPANGSASVLLPSLPHRTGVDEVFGGTLRYNTRCLCCESNTERREEFHDLSLPVPLRPEGLHACFGAVFETTERLNGANKFYCETCHTYCEARRSTAIACCPEVLTVHLNRSNANGHGKVSAAPGRGKRQRVLVTGRPLGPQINTHVHVPVALDVAEWCVAGVAASYDLLAIIFHSGQSAVSGHYFAYVRGEEEAPPPPQDPGAAAASCPAVEPAPLLPAARPVAEAPISAALEGPRLLGGRLRAPGLRPSSEVDGKVPTGSVQASDREARPLPPATIRAPLPHGRVWVECDDSRACYRSQADLDRLLMPNASTLATAYILFYQRRASPGPNDDGHGAGRS
jgi:hypothetical protein